MQRGTPRKKSSDPDASHASRRRDRGGDGDADPDLSSPAFSRLRPVRPPPVFPSAAPTTGRFGGASAGRAAPRIGDYARAVVASGFLPGDERADPRLVKPALHPSNLVRGGGAGAASAAAAAASAVAAVEREMGAMRGFGEDDELLDEIDGIPKKKRGGRQRRGEREPSGFLANALAELNAPDDDDPGEALGGGIDNFAGFSKYEEDEEEGGDVASDERDAAVAARRPWIEAASPWNDDDDDDDDDDESDGEESDDEGEGGGDLRAYLSPSASSPSSSSPSSSSRAPPLSRRTAGGGDRGAGGGGGGGRFRVMALNVEEEDGNGGDFYADADADVGDFDLGLDDGFDDGPFYEEDGLEEEPAAAAAAAAAASAPSDPLMIDLITGESLSSLPAAAAAAAPTGGDDPAAAAAREAHRRASEEQRRAFDAAFCAASEALQSRLVLGVRAEAEAAAQARAALYRRNSIRALRAEGVVLAGLVATPAGEAFGRQVFALSLPRPGGRGRASEAVEAAAAALARGERPRASSFQQFQRRKRPPRRGRRGGGEGEGEEEPADEEDPEGEELPYHRFGKRDPVVLAPIHLSDPQARPLADAGTGGPGVGGDVGDPERFSRHRLVNATVLDVWPDRLIVSVGGEAADYLEQKCLEAMVEEGGLGADLEEDEAGGEAGAKREQQQQQQQQQSVLGWRVDADQPDTTTARQLAAVGMLGRPFAEVYRVTPDEKQRERERLGVVRVEGMTEAEVERSARRWREKQRRQQQSEGASAVRGVQAPSAPGALPAAVSAKFDEGMDPASPPSSSPFTAGELRVRSVLLGDPESRSKAEELPSWARNDAWQLAASRLLASGGPGVSGLNASQRAAVSSALTSTVTLWQGPPGTGKTRTLVALLTILAKAARRESYFGDDGLPLLRTEGGGGKVGAAAAEESAAVEEALREAARCVPVLACGDTNAAADGLALGLAAAGVRVVRLGAPPVRSVVFNKASGKNKGDGGSEDGANEAVLATLSLEAIAARTPKGKEAAAARAAAARASARARAAAAAEAAAALSGKLSPAAREDTRRETQRVIKVARDEARNARSDAERLEAEAADQVLLLAEVVCSTTAAAGDERRLGPNAAFRCVVLDEATQATEPSTLVPLVRGCEACVLAGDPRQLPPTVTSAEAKGSGLQQTLFERAMRGGIEPFLLDTQYRMHPALSRFPSSAFYGSRLRDGESVVEAAGRAGAVPGGGFPWPAPAVPLAFVDADDCSERSGGGGGSSVSNPGEVALAMRSAALLLQAKVREEEAEEEEAAEERARLLLEVEAAGGGEEEAAAAVAAAAAAAARRSKDPPSPAPSAPAPISSVAILSPYAGQVRLLRAALRLAPPRLRSKVIVSTIDGFQGREADAVVLSTVRSNARGSLGFVADPRRANVALTRARRALVVVGAPSTLAGGDSNAVGVWRDWLDSVSELGAFLPGGALPLAPWEEPEEGVEEERREERDEWAEGGVAAEGGEGELFDPSSSQEQQQQQQQFISSPPLDEDGGFKSSFGDTAGSVLEWGDPIEEEFSVD